MGKIMTTEKKRQWKNFEAGDIISKHCTTGGACYA
jgi:hypothetical protein